MILDEDVHGASSQRLAVWRKAHKLRGSACRTRSCTSIKKQVGTCSCKAAAYLDEAVHRASGQCLAVWSKAHDLGVALLAELDCAPQSCGVAFDLVSLALCCASEQVQCRARWQQPLMLLPAAAAASLVTT